MTIHRESNRALCSIFTYGLVLLFASALNAADPRTAVGAVNPLEEVWSFSLPLKMTTTVESYHLLEGNVYAVTSDGMVRCIRADRGDFLWIAQVGRPGDVIWPPIAYHSADLNAVGFASLEEAVFLDPQSGLVKKRFKLTSPLTGGLAAGDKGILATSVDRTVSRYDIADGWPRWKIATRGVLSIAPVYLWGEDYVVTADESGRVTATDAARVRKYIIKLDGTPRGWLGVDATTIYVATGGDAALLHALDRRTGNALREPFRLAGPPRGGPVVTPRSVYQATLPSGLHRVGLVSGVRHWYHRNAALFLAEWAEQTAVLTGDGRIGLVDAQTGEANVIAGREGYATGVSNPYNDAIIVATERGQLRCFRPAGALPLDVEAFHPTTQPAQATQPAEAAKVPQKVSPATILTTVRPRPERPAAAPAEKPVPAEPAARQPAARQPQLPTEGQNAPMDRLRQMLQNATGQPPQNRPQERPRY